MLLTGNALCNNPRAQKEAASLAAAGFRVTVLGAWLSSELKQRDLELLAGARYGFEAVIDFADKRVAARTASLSVRLRTGLARKCHGLSGLESRWQLGYAVDELLRRALRSDADLFIAHSESGLYAARQLQRSGRQAGVDMEDWFSEDITPEAKRGRPLGLLRALERDVLNQASHATCTSAAMSQALADCYGCVAPTVIYNAFPWADRKLLDGQWKDRPRGGRLSIHWYSQTLGPGRGLEDLITALPLVKADMEVHLRGRPAPGYREHLLDRLPPGQRERLYFHDLVSGSELLSRIVEHDIGFSGEVPTIPSRDLTVTNKILHYLLAGIPVVASDTTGNREVAGRAQAAVFLWPAGGSRELGSQLDFLLLDSDRLVHAKAAALAAAEERFCWERSAPQLVRSVESGLSGLKA